MGGVYVEGVWRLCTWFSPQPRMQPTPLRRSATFCRSAFAASALTIESYASRLEMNGVAGGMHGVAGGMHGIAGRVHGVAGRVHGVAGRVHGATACDAQGCIELFTRRAPDRDQHAWSVAHDGAGRARLRRDEREIAEARACRRRVDVLAQLLRRTARRQAETYLAPSAAELGAEAYLAPSAAATELGAEACLTPSADRRLYLGLLRHQ